MTDTKPQSLSTPHPVRRRYPDAPLVGVAAAVFDAAGRVLLVQRGRPPRAGSWGLPGGLLEVGESLVAGVRREVREECGVEIAVGDVAGVFEPITRDEEGRVEYHYVVIDFWASWLSGEAHPHDDAAAVAWAAIDALDAYNLLPDSRKVIEKAYEMWRLRD
ncbi:MAG: NUDIX hydrolase [Chloroflexota bacterium]|jgi:ADP-ribose pyrophosphatase YjhB (NUDIX family)|nr:NUDIX hydrolase [Caldilinea sp.]GIK72244.1 MAG: NUDIX hydrolase [Chloroflexota bacterium]